MKKFLVLNGANLNMLGIREPDIYGKNTYKDLLKMLKIYAKTHKIKVICRQSNHEGALIDEIQRAYFRHFDGIVLNPGGYTHTSVSLADALKAVKIPTAEVHISNVSAREDFRQISYIRPVCAVTITGQGLAGYTQALDFLENYTEKQRREEKL